MTNPLLLVDSAKIARDKSKCSNSIVPLCAFLSIQKILKSIHRMPEDQLPKCTSATLGSFKAFRFAKQEWWHVNIKFEMTLGFPPLYDSV